MKTLNDLELINKLAVEYRALKYQVYSLNPKITSLSAHVAGSNNLHSVFFNERIREAVTEAGKKRLRELATDLKSHGIDVGIDDNVEL